MGSRAVLRCRAQLGNVLEFKQESTPPKDIDTVFSEAEKILQKARGYLAAMRERDTSAQLAMSKAPTRMLTPQEPSQPKPAAPRQGIRIDVRSGG